MPFGYGWSGVKSDIGATLATVRSGLSAFTLSTGSSLLNSSITEGTLPWARELRYQANNTVPNLIPDVASLSRAWLANKIDNRELQQLLAYHGIDWFLGVPQANLNLNERAWNAVMSMQQSKHSPVDYLKWMRQNRINDAKLDEMLRFHGFWDGTERTLFAEQYNSLEVSQVMSAYFIGKLTRQEAIDRLREIGFRQQEAELLIDPIHYGFSLPELITLKLRGAINAADYNKGLEAIGIRDANSKAMASEFEKAYPTISDLVLFSVREVWNPAVVQTYGYDNEFPEPFRYWLQKQGLDWGQAFPNPAGGNFPALNWPRAYWRAHWQTLSPTQAAVALQRLRPDPANPGQSVFPGVPPFTQANWNDILKIHDYAPGVRDWLRAIQYNPLRLVDIRQMRIRDLRQRPWVVSKLQDRGYTQVDANEVADLIEDMRTAAQSPAYANWKKTAQRTHTKDLVKAFKLGYLGRPQFLIRLQAMGWTATHAEQYAGMVEYQLETETVEAVVKAVKRDVFSGKSTYAEGRQRMISIGVSEYHADNYLIRWQAEFTERRKMASTSNILDWLKRGFINATSAGQRLRNLGWDNQDTLLWLSSVGQDIDIMEAKAQKASAQEAKRHAKEIAAYIKEVNRLKEGWIEKLRKLTPVSTLKTWLKKGVIDEETFRQRMSVMEFPPAVVEAHIAEVTGGEEVASIPSPEPPDLTALVVNPTEFSAKDGEENGELGK